MQVGLFIWLTRFLCLYSLVCMLIFMPFLWYPGSPSSTNTSIFLFKWKCLKISKYFNWFIYTVVRNFTFWYCSICKNTGDKVARIPTKRTYLLIGLPRILSNTGDNFNFDNVPHLSNWSSWNGFVYPRLSPVGKWRA